MQNNPDVSKYKTPLYTISFPKGKIGIDQNCIIDVGLNMKKAAKYLKYILPTLFLVLIVILFVKLKPIYRDIRGYENLQKKYRKVEFEFYESSNNPILKDKKYKDVREKEKFLREYEKLTNEIKQSPGIEKFKKIYRYLQTRYINKKDYVDNDRYVMFISKDSTYSKPIFITKVEKEMEKNHQPWHIWRIHKSKFFKKHVFLELTFINKIENLLEDENLIPKYRNQLIALDKETSIGYEISDNRGDWMKYRYPYQCIGSFIGYYDFTDPHESKVRTFNQVAEKENIKITDEKAAIEYVRFFLTTYYQWDSDGIIDEPSPELISKSAFGYLDIKPNPLACIKDGENYIVSLCTYAVRFPYGSGRFDFGEIVNWEIKVSRDGQIQTSKKLEIGRMGSFTNPYYSRVFDGWKDKEKMK